MKSLEFAFEINWPLETVVFNTKGGLYFINQRHKVLFLFGQCMNQERTKNLSIITKSEEVNVIR